MPEAGSRIPASPQLAAHAASSWLTRSRSRGWPRPMMGYWARSEVVDGTRRRCDASAGPPKVGCQRGRLHIHVTTQPQRGVSNWSNDACFCLRTLVSRPAQRPGPKVASPVDPRQESGRRAMPKTAPAWSRRRLMFHVQLAGTDRHHRHGPPRRPGCRCRRWCLRRWRCPRWFPGSGAGL